MDSFVDFLSKNYIWFLVAAVILVFALIGYLVDSRNKKNPKIEEKKKTKEEKIKEDVKKIESVSLNEAIKKETPKDEFSKPEETTDKTEETYDEPLIKEDDSKDSTFKIEN